MFYSAMEPLERRFYGNERYRARERERRTRRPGPDLGYQIGPVPGGADIIALGPVPHVRRRARDDRRAKRTQVRRPQPA